MPAGILGLIVRLQHARAESTVVQPLTLTLSSKKKPQLPLSDEMMASRSLQSNVAVAAATAAAATVLAARGTGAAGVFARESAIAIALETPQANLSVADTTSKQPAHDELMRTRTPSFGYSAAMAVRDGGEKRLASVRSRGCIRSAPTGQELPSEPSRLQRRNSWAAKFEGGEGTPGDMLLKATAAPAEEATVRRTPSRALVGRWDPTTSPPCLGRK